MGPACRCVSRLPDPSASFVAFLDPSYRCAKEGPRPPGARCVQSIALCAGSPRRARLARCSESGWRGAAPGMGGGGGAVLRGSVPGINQAARGVGGNWLGPPRPLSR